MSDMGATVTRTDQGFAVTGEENLSYDFVRLDGVFDPRNPQLAECYTKWGRVFAVLDQNMKKLYGHEIEEYFRNHDLPVTFHAMAVGEKAKTIDSLLGICDAMTDFGIIRKEPVLVVGGGLVTDVAGFACACYRRNTNYIRVPTTLIGLIDASVSIKVAVNFGNYKNRLGAYHAPMRTFLDFGFLKTLPICQVRNGFAELIKISSCKDLVTFDLLAAHCKELINTKFGRAAHSDPQIKDVADRICDRSIYEMLRLETPNLHEIMLDRVIAYGHTWSPLHELRPKVPLRHGHAISIDMAYSATLAMVRGLLSKDDHAKLLGLFSQAGLAIDHSLFDETTLSNGTKAILKTRDGQLRLAVPSPSLGHVRFINEYTIDELQDALRIHKEIAAQQPRRGDGIEAYVDASDTGEEITNGVQLDDLPRKPTLDGPAPHTNGVKDRINGSKKVNGFENGFVKNGVAVDGS